MKLIIFDLDGTLTDDKLIGPARIEEQIKFISKKLKIGYDKAKEKYFELKKKAKSSIDIFTMLGFTRKQYFKVIDKTVPERIVKLRKNCKKTLKELNKKYKIIILSNATTKIGLKTLRMFDIEKYIKNIYGAEKFNISKPSTSIFKEILNKEGFKADEAISVGDHVIKDVIYPKKIGITGVLFDPYKKYKGKEADYVINDLIELVSLFSK